MLTNKPKLPFEDSTCPKFKKCEFIGCAFAFRVNTSPGCEKKYCGFHRCDYLNCGEIQNAYAYVSSSLRVCEKHVPEIECNVTTCHQLRCMASDGGPGKVGMYRWCPQHFCSICRRERRRDCQS